MGEHSILGEMEHLVSPFCYSQETKLREVDRNLMPRNKYLQGFISEDCKWGCFFNNASVQCFSVDTKISDYHYLPRSHVNLAIPVGPYTFPPRSVITCGCELGIHKQRPWTGGLNRVLLGLDCTGVAPHYNQGGGEGALAIYDQVQQQVVKWIPLAEPVTNVKVLAHFETGDSIKPFFNGAMMAMVGIAAVGMKGGKVIVVDLGLDKTEFIPAAGIVTFASVTAPKQSIPFTVIDVDPFERLIATNRHIAIRQNQLISLSVGDPANSESNDTFIYAHPNGVEITRFDKSQVDVTALEYVGNIGCLLVGFSFGGFQLWRVDDLSLQYSSNLPEFEACVLSFGFQQPIDDPKNFCYIWILYGAQTYQMSQSKLDLYQLFFLEKPHIENFGSIYQNLQKCAKSLSITLEDVFLPRDESIEDEQEALERYLVHPLRLWIKNELVFISWKVSRSELFYVGIFDLNQWYSSYTSARIPTAELGPFWVTIPVERSKSEGSIPWDFRLVPNSLQRWENQFKQVDIHFYPSSITFQGICLTTRGYYAFEHFGIQEKIIRIILKDGHSLMAEPALLRQYCRTYGLQPATASFYEPELLSEKDIDRFYIFTALLECKRPALIVKMANAWLDGSFTNVGCTIDLIIDWVKDLSLTIRFLAEQHWDNVFHLSAENMLPETKNFVVYSNFVWNSLLSLLNILIRHDEVYNVSRMPRLDGLKYSLEKLVQYSAAILMFYQADILPTNDVIINSMVEYHSQRRSVVKQALESCDVIPEDVKKTYPYLVIDQMIAALGEEFVRKEWNLDPTDDLYPPRHAGYVTNMTLWKNIDFKLISRVVFYFILDFMFAAQLPSSKLRGDFASVIRLNSEEQEEIYNIWHVDHGYFDEALTYMAQNPKFNGRDESAASWATAFTIVTGFKSSEAVKGLFNMGCPPYLAKLYINIMGHDRLLYKKLLSDVCKTSVMLETELLHHFFQVAMDQNFLLEFITVKLHEAPEPIPTELVAFLERHSSFDYSSLLLAFYAKVRNIDKANQLYKVMRDLWGTERGLNAKQKEIWTHLINTMQSWDMVKKENVVMDFLNMKRHREVPVPPAPVITIRPRRIVHLMSSSVNTFDSKPVNDYAELSPLKMYVPKVQSPENLADSMNASIDDEARSDLRSRRSMAFDVESILRTPIVDHRKSRQREEREGSVDNCRYETPPPGEDMHSILKTSARSSRSRSALKTRFIDPTSGEELKSPEEVLNIAQFPSQTSPVEAAVARITPRLPLWTNTSSFDSPSFLNVPEKPGKSSPSEYMQTDAAQRLNFRLEESYTEEINDPRQREEIEGSGDNSKLKKSSPGEDDKTIARLTRSRSALKAKCANPKSGEELESPECMSPEDPFNIAQFPSQPSSIESAAVGSTPMVPVYSNVVSFTPTISFYGVEEAGDSSPNEYVQRDAAQKLILGSEESYTEEINEPRQREEIEGSGDNSKLEKSSPGEDDKTIARLTRSRSALKAKCSNPNSGEKLESPECMSPEDPFNIAQFPSQPSSIESAAVGITPMVPVYSNVVSFTPTISFYGVEEAGDSSPNEYLQRDAAQRLNLGSEESYTEEKDMNVSAPESNDSFADADGHSLEMSVEPDMYVAQAVEPVAETKEFIPPLPVITTPVKVDEGGEEVFLSPDSNISVTEFDRNLECGDEINLSTASTEVGSSEQSPVETSPTPTSKVRLSLTPEPEEFNIATAGTTPPKTKALERSKVPLMDIFLDTNQFLETSDESSPDKSQGSLLSPEIDTIPETPAAKGIALFERTRADDSLFTTSLRDLSAVNLVQPTPPAPKSHAKPHTSTNVAEISCHEVSSLQDDSMFSATEESFLDTTTENILDLGPRRLTRRQKALLEKSIGQGTISQMGEANLTPPKHSPVKEKSPSRSAGRSRRGKSEGPVSVGSSEEVKVKRRYSRRSETPESDISETSGRRLTRSQIKKLDSSLSGSQSSLDSHPVERTTRARSRAKTPSLEPVLEDSPFAATMEEKPKMNRRKSTGARAKSEPPQTATQTVTTPKKRGRKTGAYAPDLSTVMEMSDTSLATTPRQERYKRRRPSEIESVAEEPEEEEESDKSILDTSAASTSTKRSRRSVTPMSHQSSDTPVSTPRRRKRATSVK